ncbi:hypothetical protein C8R42DRAFT_745667 [Lentinula raphanica]|nr:hypothetical protein C8R42DRAFT_745667 [Lentinula raphanica]
MSVPWAGVHVRIIRGEYKSYQGYVYDVRPDDKSISGLKMVLELGTHIYPTGAAARITVDYDDVREFQHWRPLEEICSLESQHIQHLAYSFKPNYSPAQIHIPYVPQPEQEDIVRYHTPIPDPSIGIDEFWGIQNSSDDEMKPQDAHWILHPSFNNHCLHVTIDHPQYGTTGKWIDIRNDKEHIQKPKISPRHTSKSILAIIDGEHHGRFVRCIGKGKREVVESMELFDLRVVLVLVAHWTASRFVIMNSE